ncbi:histidine kinase, partial [Streptomyces sp. NPDC058855]
MSPAPVSGVPSPSPAHAPGPPAPPPPPAARVSRLLEAMRSVGSGLELHSTLERICETAAALTGA